METDRSNLCGCKGIRTCLACEKVFGIEPKDLKLKEVGESYVYCNECNKCWPGWDFDSVKSHPNHTGNPFLFKGVFVQNNFLTEDEERSVVSALDNLPWDISQSGRRKQNFGPKCNFKKRSLKLGNFNGFPECTKFIQDRFEEVDILRGYQTIEQCSLEYDPVKGASIDAHIDDCWVWGERIISVNLLADSVLTLVPYRGDSKKYNLDCAPPPFPQAVGNHTPPDVVVRLPMPRRSLLVITDEARYLWEHLILREDIQSRRICLAYREFTSPFLPGGNQHNVSREVLLKANCFWS